MVVEELISSSNINQSLISDSAVDHDDIADVIDGDGGDHEDECGFTKHQWLFIKFVLTSCLGTCVGIFGIFGNVTTAAVLMRPVMRTANNLYLTALAGFDTLVLVLAVLLYSTEYVQEYFDSVEMYIIWTTYAPYMYAMSNFAQTGSVYITVSVTFERYFAVVHPRLSQTQCTRPRSIGVIIFVVMFAAAFNVPKFFEVEVARNENCTGFAAQSLAPSSLLMDPLYATVYTLWLSQFVMVFFPFAVLLTINTAIVWNFKKSLRKLDCKVMDSSDRGILKEQSRDATRVLVTIVVVFLLCNCWGFVITVMESIYGGRALAQWAPEFYAFSREAINFLAIVNSSINFLICLTFSDDFRHELLIVYGCRRQKTTHKTIKYLISRRRKAFSDNGRSLKQLAQSARITRPGRMRYVDRLHSGESLANYTNGSLSDNSLSGPPRVPSFSALIEAAHHMVINRAAGILAERKDSTKTNSTIRGDSPIKEIERYAKQQQRKRSSVSNGYCGGNHAVGNGSLKSTDDDGAHQPFLYRNNFVSECEMEWETMI